MDYFAFIDFEFNQGNSNKKEEIISIGCVIANSQFEEVESFYSLSKPSVHTKMNIYVSKLTGIWQKDIDEAPSFLEVSEKFAAIIDKYSNIQFYSWGNSDFVALINTCKMNSCKILLKKIKKMTDLQIEIMAGIVDNGKRVWFNSKKLSLINHFYNQPQLKSHNALNDARMLCNIYMSFKKRGKYDFKTNSFDNMDGVSKEDILIANKTVYGERLKERRERIVNLKRINKADFLECKLDGNIYYLLQPILSEPLFTKRRRRKYDDYTIKIIFNEDDVCIELYLYSSENDRYMKFEADGDIIQALRPAIKSIKSKTRISS